VKVQKDRIKQAEEWFFEGKKGMNEYVDYSLTASTNREAFKNTVTSLYSYLATMYRISSGHEDEVKLLLLQYLGRTKDNSEYIVATDVAMPWSKSTTYTFLQGFVKDNALLLANYGIDTTNPYPQLAEFASNFQTTLDVQENREGYFPMVDGKLFSHQERIYLEGRTLLADKPIARPKVVPYGGYVEDSNALYVRGTLGKYKSSQFGITYWTLVVIDKAGKEYLLATPVVGKMPTSPKFTLEDGQRVIEDYLANFSETDSPKSDKDFDLADN
jgi:hypothetical protein